MTNPNPQPTPPLWRVMRDATHAAMNKYHPFCTDEQSYAAELRAIADIVYEDFNCRNELAEHPANQIIDWLVGEADRAERGEVE